MASPCAAFRTEPPRSSDCRSGRSRRSGSRSLPRCTAPKPTGCDSPDHKYRSASRSRPKQRRPWLRSSGRRCRRCCSGRRVWSKDHTFRDSRTDYKRLASSVAVTKLLSPNSCHQTPPNSRQTPEINGVGVGARHASPALHLWSTINSHLPAPESKERPRSYMIPDAAKQALEAIQQQSADAL